MNSRSCIVLMCVVLITNAIMPRAQAEVIGTSTVIASESMRSTYIDSVRAALDRQQVSERLTALGVDRAQLDARLSALTDAELAQLAQRLDQQPAGGILAVLGIVLVVLLVLEYTGTIDIFKRVP